MTPQPIGWLGIVRLVAFVVAPGLASERILDALRGRILAEEAAAHAVRSLSNESIERARNRRPVVLASLAACAVVAGLAFLFARSGLVASEPSDNDRCQRR